MTAPDLSSRDAILDAAERLFALRGLAGTTIKQIGAEAGVNAALLYYYFPSKDALYDAVLDRLLTRFAAGGGSRLDAAATPEAAVRALVEWQAHGLMSQPHLPRLLIRELVDHAGEHAAVPFTEGVARLFGRLCDVIRAGQESGAFRRDVDPAFAAVSTIAQLAYAFVARPALGIILGHGLGGPPDAVMREYARHAADFALAALRPLPPRPEERA